MSPTAQTTALAEEFSSSVNLRAALSNTDLPTTGSVKTQFDEVTTVGRRSKSEATRWNPFEDPTPFHQMTEEHFIEAEFDAIRDRNGQNCKQRKCILCSQKNEIHHNFSFQRQPNRSAEAAVESVRSQRQPLLVHQRQHNSHHKRPLCRRHRCNHCRRFHQRMSLIRQREFHQLIKHHCNCHHNKSSSTTQVTIHSHRHHSICRQHYDRVHRSKAIEVDANYISINRKLRCKSIENITNLARKAFTLKTKIRIILQNTCRSVGASTHTKTQVHALDIKLKMQTIEPAEILVSSNGPKGDLSHLKNEIILCFFSFKFYLQLFFLCFVYQIASCHSSSQRSDNLTKIYFVQNYKNKCKKLKISIFWIIPKNKQTKTHTRTKYSFISENRNPLTYQSISVHEFYLSACKKWIAKMNKIEIEKWNCCRRLIPIILMFFWLLFIDKKLSW